uniref:Peptidase S1 domain-containing protein n=1 Tax=Panagrolaimus sp. ES5 TaxID=591445 RepID=A0AC34G5R0_9BILA
MNAEMLIVFFVAAIFLQLQQNVYGFNQNRIVNGSATPDGVFEFLPRLIKLRYILQNYKMETGICSSTIISKRHILSAAHCFHVDYKVSGNDIFAHWNHQVPVLFVQPRSNVTDYRFRSMALGTKIYNHPSYYSIYTFEHDIAIIEFPEGTDFQIPPVKLASNYVAKEGDMAIAAGYGVYKWQGSQINGKSEIPKVLQNATLPVTLNCGPKAICVGTCERHADEGDSGGPLMFERNGEYYQVGILSTVIKANESSMFTTYTRISDNCEWISKITKGEASCEPLPDDPNPQPLKPQSQLHCGPDKARAAPENAPLTGNSNFATFNFFSHFLLSFSLLNFYLLILECKIIGM